MKDLQPLFNAQSIAVVGASAKPDSFGGQILRNLIDYGYAGKLFGVHPKHESLFSQPCFRSISEAPVTPDCVALAVANHRLLALLEEAGSCGVKAAVVFGDPNVGAGRAPELQDQIAELAKRHELIVCGPNAMGVYALHHRLVISGYPVSATLPVGKTALITASGTVFDALSQNNRQVAFNYVVSCGNEASLSAADYLYHVVSDPDTEVVALYLETVRNPRDFVEALKLARDKQIPIITLKVGLSARGRIMAQAHTGALAGDAETYEALFRRYGVAQVHSLDEMMDTVELMSKVRRVHGNRLAALMESGGERSLVADLSQGLNIEFAELDSPSRTRLETIIDEGVHPDNPLDAFGSGHDVERVYTECLEAMDQNSNTNLLLLAVDLVRDSYLSPLYVAAALAAQPRLKNPLAAMVNLSAGANIQLMAELRSHGIPVLMGTDSALRAISHLFDFNAVHETSVAPERVPRHNPELNSIRATLADAGAAITEHDSKLILSSYGLRITQEFLASTLESAVQAAETIGYPVVIKTAEANLLHKSEVGGIHLNLRDENSVRDAYTSLAADIGPQVVVQEMMSGGTEMLLGMKSDNQFGPIVVVGMGGIFLEIYKDVIATLPEISADEARWLLSQLQGYALLTGARGREPADLDALTDTLLAFADFVVDCGDLLAEVDINPLLVQSDGVIVLDALIVPKQTANAAQPLQPPGQ